MSELDTLTRRSLSGVPMRPKPPKHEPTAGELVAVALDKLAGALTAIAARDDKLAAALAAVASPRQVEAPKPATEPLHRKVDFAFTRGADGKIDQGVATNGDQSWRIVINRVGGMLTINALPS